MPMHDTDRAICLTRLHAAAGLPAAALVDAVGYSRFKHGDAYAARRFGTALATLAAQGEEPGSILVTTSAYRWVPPAAHSLLMPFVHQLRLLRPDLRIGSFRVVRQGVSNGDYARMTSADRRRAVEAADLTPERDVSGARVLALDDIRVTGNHEHTMDRCLARAGVDRVRHLYVVDAAAFAGHPQIESVLNEAAIAGAAQLLDIAAGRRFVPNARLCRRVLALTTQQQRLFVDGADPALLGWLDAAIEQDRLASLPAYADRVRVWQAVRAAGEPDVGSGAG